jgi:hypothetical protein
MAKKASLVVPTITLKPASKLVESHNGAADSKARRAAMRAGLHATKSREQTHSNRRGGYQLHDKRCKVVHGKCFELTAADVITYCRSYEKWKRWAQKAGGKPPANRSV